MNSVQLMGRLTADPDIRYTQSAEPIAVARFSLAVQRRKQRDKEPVTDFFNIVAWRNRADFAQKYLSKGQRVAVTGELQTRTFDDKNGIKRWVTEVIAENIYFADSKANGGGQQGGGFTEMTDDDGDMPF